MAKNRGAEGLAFALRSSGPHTVLRAAQDRMLDDGGVLFGKLIVMLKLARARSANG